LKNIFKRSITGLIYIILLFVALFGGKITYGLFFLLVTFAAMNEFYVLTGKTNVSAQKYAGILAGGVLFTIAFIYFSGYGTWKLLLFPLLFLPVFFIIELFRNKDKPFENVAFTILGIVYVAVPLAIMNSFVFSEYAGEIVYIPDVLAGVYILIITNDTLAYLFGIFFGRHRILERISPKKSWEGFAGGAAGAFFAGFILSLIFPVMEQYQWYILSFVVIVFGTFGDFAESMMKRSINTKDSGSLLPGHGGILDRLDALLFVVPVAGFYFYYSGINLSLS